MNCSYRTKMKIESFLPTIQQLFWSDSWTFETFHSCGILESRELSPGRIRETLVSSAMEESIELEVISSSSMNAYAGASSSSCSQYLTAQTESIEDSMVHWSVLTETDSDLSDDQIIADNKEVFKSLQSHPEWGRFFRTYNKESDASLVVKDKFAEGAQAEIFNVFLNGPNMTEADRKEKWALKVFKKGTLLQHLQSQWPHGYLQWMEQDTNGGSMFLPFVAFVVTGTLLPTGQFAFLIEKEVEDLRGLIVRNRPYCDYGHGPFKKKTMETFLYQIASGMDWLHKHDIVHRDLKASNVLVSRNTCSVADFECSNGVIGTGFWRDPQILQACIERNASQRPELFTRASDVYSYGMTCYEILTWKLPFEEEFMTINLVIEGQRPNVPKFVNDWIKDLLCKCWETDRHARPTFEEILNIVVANTTSSYIKSRHELDMKINNKEIKLLLGCNKLSHGLEMMECSPYESGVYKCNLCFKYGYGAVYHCGSCGDFDLHPRCATIPIHLESVLHPHSIYLLPGFLQNKIGITCSACQLEILEGNYYDSYKCLEEVCDFDLHIHCALYARAISHHLHEEHELLLTSSSISSVDVGEIFQVCNSCNIQLDSLEIVYCCEKCGFSVHPHCIIGKLECKSW